MLLFPPLFLSLSLSLSGLQILSFIGIIVAAVALDDLNEDYDELDEVLNLREPSGDWDWEDTANLAKSACGFLIFVSFLVLVIEGLMIALRFLNFGIVDKYITIFVIVVSN